MGLIIGILAIIGLVAVVSPHHREVCHYNYNGDYICVVR